MNHLLFLSAHGFHIPSYQLGPWASRANLVSWDDIWEHFYGFRGAFSLFCSCLHPWFSFQFDSAYVLSTLEITMTSQNHWRGSRCQFVYLEFALGNHQTRSRPKSFNLWVTCPEMHSFTFLMIGREGCFSFFFCSFWLTYHTYFSFIRPDTDPIIIVN